MNVIGCRPDGWWRDRRAAMGALVERLEQWAVRENADVTVVFERPPTPPIASSVITVTHAPAPATPVTVASSSPSENECTVCIERP